MPPSQQERKLLSTTFIPKILFIGSSTTTPLPEIAKTAYAPNSHKHLLLYQFFGNMLIKALIYTKPSYRFILQGRHRIRKGEKNYNTALKTPERRTIFQCKQIVLGVNHVHTPTTIHITPKMARTVKAPKN